MNVKSILSFVFFLSFLGNTFSQSVGTTEGVFNVSDVGAANYSIPIKVPDGVNGLQPNIAISYSSQAGNGPLGMGWTISGLSSITRVGNIIYNDSKVNGITLTNSDRFALDGNRLVVTEGSYGTSASKYRTEVETFKDITANGTLAGGPLSFTVTDQNGVTYEYGGTGGYVIAQGSSAPHTWLLKKVTDLNGNLMTIIYSIYDGSAFPTEIAYNKNINNVAAANTFVKFIYAGSQNFESFGYIAGGKISSYTVLEGIKVVRVIGTEKVYRSYNLDYEIDFYPHLTKVTETGAEELETLNPTEFTYGATVSAIYEASVNNLNSGSTYSFVSGDFNGDGRSDVIRLPTNYTSSYNDWKMYNNVGNGFTSVQSVAMAPLPDEDNNTKYISVLSRTNGSLFFDYNGDGKEDFMYRTTLYPNGISYNDYVCRFNLYLSDGTSLNLLTNSIKQYYGSTIGDIRNVEPFTGDFDGDGKSEVLAIGYYSWDSHIIGEKYMTVSNGNYIPYKFSAPFAISICPPGWNPNYNNCGGSAQPKNYVIDYNGDGKSEILNIKNGEANIYELNVTFDANNNPVIGNPVFKLVASNGYPSVWHDVFVGDFNGDRITDVLTHFQDNNTYVGWEIGYGKGDGHFAVVGPAPALGGRPKYGSSSRPLIIADFNGDGKSDIFNYAPTGSAGWTYNSPEIFYSKGNNQFISEDVSNIEPRIASLAEGYFLGDFGGDGSTDFLSIRAWAPGYELKLFSFHTNETRHLLSKVKNGLGYETKVSYLSLANSPVYSSGSNTYTYPYIKRTLPIKVVSNINTENAVNTTGNNTTYTYTGLKFNAHGKGLMGFDKVASLNQSSLIKTEKSFGLNTTYAFPYLQTTTTKYNNVLLNMTSGSAYNVYHYGNKRIFPYQNNSDQYNGLTGEYVQTANNYVFPSGPFIPVGVVFSHIIGKPFSITTEKGYGLDVSTQTFTYPNYETYSSGGTTYLPVWVYSKPSKIVTSNTRQGQPAYTRAATFAYDATYGYLNQSVTDLGTLNEAVTGAYYDAYGNPWLKYKSAAGLPSQSEAMTYDASHRYVIETFSLAFTNIKNKATYNPLTGDKLTETAPDGFAATYTYDGFGRLKTTSDNNGLSTATTYNWGYSLPGDNVSYLGAVYFSTTTNNAGALNYTLYDKLGREMKNKTKNFQGQLVGTRKLYNALGQVKSITKPAFDNDPLQYIDYTYDAYGRQTQIAAPEGNTTFAYGLPNSSGMVTSSTNPTGQTTKVKTDPSGAKISAWDAENNEMTYVYHSNGNVKSVSAAGTTLQTYTYDDYNHLKERWDPNYGTYKYTYNAFDQILTQTDPKNQTYSFNYDALGRMYKKTGPEGDYLYEFNNNTGLNCGKLTKLTGPEGEINYINGLGDKIDAIGYDDYGMVAELTGNALSGTQIKTFTYDNFGRIQKEGHWPSNTNIWYEYGGVNGELTQIVNHDNSTVFYEKTSENAMGQTTSYRQANTNGYELYTDIAYDSHNLITGQISYDNTTVRNMEYNFDAASGNLLSRKDNKYGLTETFGYNDNLNRLTSISNVSNPALDINLLYSANGNIEEKTDAGGSFEYDQANRLSIINLDPNLPESIPHATQELAYTPFDKVSTISERKYHTKFYYWPDGSRSMMETTHDFMGTLGYTLYVPGVETKYTVATNEVEFYNYVKDPGDNVKGIIAGDYTSMQDYFVLTDHLGSFTQIVDENGNVAEEKSFDAWGRLRDPQTWEPYAANIDEGQPQQLFERGYTGHEHLPYYGIVNMNGRLYDPIMGRMFSPDVNIVGGGSLQGYNRYTYALNNPLSYTDPDGNNPLIVAIGIGAAISALSYTGHVAFSAEGFQNWNWESFALNTAVGGFSGAMTFGVGSAGITSALGNTGFIAGFVNGAVTGGIGGFLSGATNGMINGSGNILKDGLNGAAWGAITGGFINGTSQGIEAARNHSNFFTAMTDLDLSKGYGAHGIMGKINQRIRGRYLGQYLDAAVYEGSSSIFGTGRSSGGITLPGYGITVGPGVYPNGYTELLQHEYGHILQARDIGYISWYKTVGPESLMSASFNSYAGHNNYWTETWANYLSSKYIQGYITSPIDFPIKNISSWFRNYLISRNFY